MKRAVLSNETMGYTANAMNGNGIHRRTLDRFKEIRIYDPPDQHTATWEVETPTGTERVEVNRGTRLECETTDPMKIVRAVAGQAPHLVGLQGKLVVQ